MRRETSPSSYLFLPGLVGLLLLMAGFWLLPARTQAQAESDALLRFLNASPDATVDVYIEDARTAESLDFTAATDYGTIPAGLYTIKVVAAGASLNEQPLLEGSAQLMPGVAHSLVLFDRAQSLKAQLLIDDLTPPESGASVRFFNAALEASVVDIVTAGGQTLFQSVPFGQEGASLRLAAGEYTLQVRPVGSTTPVLTETLRAGDGAIQTVLAVGVVNQDPPLQLWTVEYPPLGTDLSGVSPLIPGITAGEQATPGAETPPAAAEPSATPAGVPAQASPEPTITQAPASPYPPPATATATEVVPTEAPVEATPIATATIAPTETPARATPTTAPEATATPQAGLPTTGGEGDGSGGLGALLLMVLGLALLDAGVLLFWRREWGRLRRPF